jgi:predicted XRE-type DNA-binding protein
MVEIRRFIETHGLADAAKQMGTTQSRLNGAVRGRIENAPLIGW